MIYALIFLPIVLIAVALAALTLGFIKKRNYHKRFRLLAFLPVLAAGYFIITPFYPDDNFYKKDFKEVTGLEFPEQGKILWKTASYPDHHGDYQSTFAARIPKDFFETLPVSLLSNGFIEQKSDFRLPNVEELKNKKIQKNLLAEMNLLLELTTTWVFYLTMKH